jgi:hypothetical protein
VRAPLRSVLVGICVLPATLLAAAPALAEGPQRSATPSVTAEIGYAHEQVQAGGQDTMTVNLVNHGPQDLDDQTSVHVTVTMPQNTEVDPNVLETIPGNAPSGSNAVASTRTVPLGQVFTRSAPGFFDVVVPAGSFGNSASFRTYAFTLHVAPNVTAGAQLTGGGVAVALENYVGLTVSRADTPPPPVVVPPSKNQPAPPKGAKPATPSAAGSGGRSSSVWTRGVSPSPTPRCASGGGSGAMGGSGGAVGTGGPGGSTRCACPTGVHKNTAGGGQQCAAGGLASTGTGTAWPLALAVLALAAGTALLRVAHRSGRK